jgi:hypothetical protein
LPAAGVQQHSCVAVLKAHIRQKICVICQTNKHLSGITVAKSDPCVACGFCKTCGMVLHLNPLLEWLEVHQLSEFVGLKSCFKITHSNIGMQLWAWLLKQMEDVSK